MVKVNGPARCTANVRAATWWEKGGACCRVSACYDGKRDIADVRQQHCRPTSAISWLLFHSVVRERGRPRPHRWRPRSLSRLQGNQLGGGELKPFTLTTSLPADYHHREGLNASCTSAPKKSTTKLFMNEEKHKLNLSSEWKNKKRLCNVGKPQKSCNFAPCYGINKKLPRPEP